MADRGWKQPFEDPIPLPRGPPTCNPTRQDAAGYVMKLPKVEQDLLVWQVAAEALIMVAEGRGPQMHARIGMLRALNRHVERLDGAERQCAMPSPD